MYNFDEIIDRRNTNAMNTDGYKGYIFKDENIELPYKDEEYVRLWLADMDIATPDVILDAIRERLDKRILGYSRVYSDDYYDAFSSWCKSRYDWSFSQEDLYFSNGIIPALNELVKYICKEGERVLFLTPSYANFQSAADLNDRETVLSDLKKVDDHYEIDFEDLEEKASHPNTKLFIFCNPHNPTGRVWTQDELERVGEIIEKYDLWVISDEIHCDLLRKGQQHIPLAKVLPNHDKIITCMAPSKTFNMAGMMFSNIIIPNEELQKVWETYHYNFDNPLSIAAAQAAYEKGGPWLEELTQYIDDNFEFTQSYLAEHLPEAEMNISEATYLAWIDVSHYFSPETDLPLFYAENAGVLLEGGDMFVDNSDGFIRLNLANPHSFIEEGLKRICEATQKQVSQ